MELKVEYVSQRHHHGKSAVKRQRIRSAALGKLAKEQLLERIKSGDARAKVTEASAEVQKAAGAKVYGSHDGSTQVHTLLSGEFEGKVTGDLLTKLENIVNRHEIKALSSFDVKQAKRAYKAAKASLEAEYRTRYGDELSEQQADALQNAIAKHGFDYYANQIVIKIYSDEQFGSASYSERDGRWVYTVHTKTVFTQIRPSFEEADSYKKLAETTTNLVNVTAATMGLRMRWVASPDSTAQGHYEIIRNGMVASANAYT